MDERLWPHPILKPEAEWTDFDRDYIYLMQVAFAERYSPREGPCQCVDLGQWPEGRSISLVRRGPRNGGEPFLGESSRSIRLGPIYDLPLGEYACVCIRAPFCGAAHLALEWTRGRSLDSLLNDFEFIGGNPAGIILRPEVVMPSMILRNQEANPLATEPPI